MDRSPALDEKFLRRSFDVARRAREHGNHPFGAVLVSGLGQVLLEVENGFLPDHDMTGHAERLLATQASKQFASNVLINCTLYSSAEPCAMCAGAIYWAGIGRVVYGLSEKRLKSMIARPRRESDARSALPHRVQRRPAPGGGDRPAARRRSRRDSFRRLAFRQRISPRRRTNDFPTQHARIRPAGSGLDERPASGRRKTVGEVPCQMRRMR